MSGFEVERVVRSIRLTGGCSLMELRIKAVTHGGIVKFFCSMLVPDVEAWGRTRIRPERMDAVSLIEFQTEKDVLDYCRKLLHAMVTHEVDEGFVVEKWPEPPPYGFIDPSAIALPPGMPITERPYKPTHGPEKT